MDPKRSTPASLESSNQWFEQELKDQADRIKAYQEQYAQIRCDAANVPKLLHYRVSDVFLREQRLDQNLHLALKGTSGNLISPGEAFAGRIHEPLRGA
jgi:hypothetical protein